MNVSPSFRSQFQPGQLIDALSPDDVGAIAIALTGMQPTFVSANGELRFRRQGSLAIDPHGKRFMDFEAGVGGGLIKLIMHLRQCNATEAWLWLEHFGWLDKALASAPAPKHQEHPAKHDYSPLASQTWSEAVPLRGSIGERYFAGRGITAESLPSQLRFHPHCLVRGRDNVLRELPAILSPIVRLDSPNAHTLDRVRCIERTFLTPDARAKADVPNPKSKAMLGSRGGGDGVPLTMNAGEGGLVVCGEGVETVLSLMLIRGHRFGAAACNAGALTKLVLPSSVKRVLIAQDYDNAGLRTANDFAGRMRREGRAVEVATPPRFGDDWNDELLRSLNEQTGRDGG